MPKLTYEAHKVVIASPYLEGYVSALKQIPSSCRDYKPHDRTWTVFHPYIDEARRLVYLYFPPNEIVEIDYDIFTDAQEADAKRKRDREEARSNQGRRQSNPFEFGSRESSTTINLNPDTADPTTDPYTVLYLHPFAPRQVVETVYKTLAKLYHPDHAKQTGKDEVASTRSMERINVAYETIKTRTGWGR